MGMSNPCRSEYVGVHQVLTRAMKVFRKMVILCLFQQTGTMVFYSRLSSIYLQLSYAYKVALSRVPFLYSKKSIRELGLCTINNQTNSTIFNDEICFLNFYHIERDLAISHCSVFSFLLKYLLNGESLLNLTCIFIYYNF